MSLSEGSHLLPLLESPTRPPQLSPLYLEILRVTGHLLLQDGDPDTLCQAIFGLLRERLQVDVYFHYLVSPDETHLELASAGGNAYLRSLLGSKLEFGQAVCGTVAQQCAPMNIAHILQRHDAMTALIREAGTRSYACYPLLIHDTLLGTISFGSTKREEFCPEDLDLFSLIAQQVAIATNRRRQQQQVREMEQLAAAGRMSAMLAHEINNPLESLSTVLYLLRDDIHSPEGLQLLQTAESQVQRLVEVTRRTLDEFRGRRPAAHRVDLSDLARNLVADISLPRQVQLEAHIEDDLCVNGVTGELRQVLFNLLLNAAQFSPPDKPVVLNIVRREQEAEIRVKDFGRGISEQTRQHLFQPFYTTRPNGGTGIGLWLSHEIIERSGGKLRFESDPDQHPGTEFIATLPLVDSTLRV